MSILTQLSNLQWLFNLFLEAGCEKASWRDLRLWMEPMSEDLVDALRKWEAEGFIALLVDPSQWKTDDVLCVKILKPFANAPGTEDENEND